MVLLVETRKFFDDLCVKHEVDCSAPRTVARLLDKVYDISLVMEHSGVERGMIS